MTGPPRAHPLHVHRPAKVILVCRLVEPAALPRRLAGRPTSLLCAVLLATAIAHIDREIIAAAQALALYLVRHGSSLEDPSSPTDNTPPSSPPAPPPAGKKIETNKTI